MYFYYLTAAAATLFFLVKALGLLKGPAERGVKQKWKKVREVP